MELDFDFDLLTVLLLLAMLFVSYYKLSVPHCAFGRVMRPVFLLPQIAARFQVSKCVAPAFKQQWQMQHATSKWLQKNVINKLLTKHLLTRQIKCHKWTNRMLAWFLAWQLGLATAAAAAAASGLQHLEFLPPSCKLTKNAKNRWDEFAYRVLLHATLHHIRLLLPLMLPLMIFMYSYLCPTHCAFLASFDIHISVQTLVHSQWHATKKKKKKHVDATKHQLQPEITDKLQLY